MPTEEGERGGIFAAVDQLLDSLAARRLEEAIRCFAPEPDIALYGSELHEAAIGPAAVRAFLEELFSRVGPRFELAHRRASSQGDVAWFTSDAMLQVGGRQLPYRITGVLVRREGRWLWTLFSGSEPAHPQPAA